MCVCAHLYGSVCVCVSCLTQHYQSITGAGFFTVFILLRVFMHVCCVCMCMFLCTVLFAQLQTQQSTLLIDSPASPDNSTQSCKFFFFLRI